MATVLGCETDSCRNFCESAAASRQLSVCLIRGGVGRRDVLDADGTGIGVGDDDIMESEKASVVENIVM